MTNESNAVLMNFAAAVGVMRNGKKVRLSDWMGYWFMDGEGNIKVFTRDGDVLDTPNIDRYKDREDWSVTDGSMGFDFAIRALKNGKRVARNGWNGKGMWLYLVPGSTFQVSEGRPLAAHSPVGESVNYRPHIDMKTADGSHVPWVASQTDMLSNDWVLV
jgi:hypothetical protein